MDLSPRIALVLGIALCLAGCGGAGGGDEVPADLQAAADTTRILFPPPGALAEAPALGIVGAIADPEGVTAVRVDGVAATSGDGFATWRAVVAVAPGSNTVTVDLEGAGGAEAFGVVSVAFPAVAHVLPGLRAIARAPSSDTLYVFDRWRNGVYAVEPSTGRTTLVSGPDRGSGTAFDPFGVEDLAVDEGHDQVLVLERERIVGVSIATGARTEVSGPAVGTGTVLQSAVALLVDAAQDRAVVLTPTTPSFVLFVDLLTGDRAALPVGQGGAFGQPTDLVRGPGDTVYVTAMRGATVAEGPRVVLVDLVLGDRQVVSADGVRGDGQAFQEAAYLAYDPTSQTVFVSDGDGRSIRTVDVTTGDRAPFADGDFGDGVDLVGARAMEGDFARGRLLVIDDRLDAVVAVDAATADRTVVYGYGRGEGGVLQAPEGLAYEPGATDAYVLDTRTERLWRIDLATGDRALVAESATGPAPPWGQPVGVDLDPAGNRALVIDKDEDLLVAVDLTSGARTVLSSPSVGAGPDLGIPHGISLEPGAGVAWIADSRSPPNGGIWSVDLATGDRTKISDGALGLGPELDLSEGCVFDAVRGDVVGLDLRGDAILRVDPATGDRTLLSGDGAGTGPAFGNLHDVNLDTARDRVLGVDNDVSALFSIHPETGARAIVAGPSRGLGPPLVWPEHAVVGPLGGYLVVDLQVGALLLIEPASGDRVILSR